MRELNLEWDPNMRFPRYKPLEAVFGGRALPEGDPSSSTATHVGTAAAELLLVEGVGRRRV